MSTIRIGSRNHENTNDNQEATQAELLYTDQFFKFPTMIHIAKDIDETESLRELGASDIVPEGAIGAVRCLHEDIVTWWDSFSAPRTIADVKRNGFDMTHVVLRGGEQFTCTWDRKTFERRLNEHVKKGPVLQTAVIAAIMGAKKTHELIPMCHPLLLTNVKCDIDDLPSLPGFRLIVTAKLSGKTGVEMEALSGVPIS